MQININICKNMYIGKNPETAFNINVQIDYFSFFVFLFVFIQHLIIKF